MSHQQLDDLKWSPSLFAVFCQLASMGCFFSPFCCHVRIAHTQVQLPPHFMVDFGYVEALRPRFCVAKQLKVPHSKMAVRPYQVQTIWGVPAGLLGFGRRVRFIGQKKHMIFMALSLLHQYGDMATALEPHWLEICKMSCQDPCPLGSWLLHCNYYHYWWCHGFA